MSRADEFNRAELPFSPAATALPASCISADLGFSSQGVSPAQAAELERLGPGARKVCRAR